ncbi:MAG: pilus assembly protein [Rhizobiaceae bacterium]|nr:pilus assembly protein [Rhizobiaceae bacterium]
MNKYQSLNGAFKASFTNLSENEVRCVFLVMSMTFSDLASCCWKQFRHSLLVTCLAFATGISLVAIAPVAIASDGSSANASLKVIIDRAKVVRIAKPADTIIVGNPSIVDATIQDSRTIVLTGRNFGVTNMIILDSDGDAIVDETIVVQGHETNTVRIYRQSVRETLACSPVCENTLTVGDEAAKFEAMDEQIKARNGLAQDAANNK